MFEPLVSTVLPALLDRGVLVVNHVLRAQPQACDRLLPHAGRSVDVDWLAPAGAWPTPPSLRLRITPAGLIERVSDADASMGAGGADLKVRIELPAPQRWVTLAVNRERPRVEVEGDAQLAADVAWLADNLRWDVEHDLARLVGDAPARIAMDMGQSAVRAIRGLAQGVSSRWENRPGPGSAAPR